MHCELQEKLARFGAGSFGQNRRGSLGAETACVRTSYQSRKLLSISYHEYVRSLKEDHGQEAMPPHGSSRCSTSPVPVRSFVLGYLTTNGEVSWCGDSHSCTVEAISHSRSLLFLLPALEKLKVCQWREFPIFDWDVSYAYHRGCLVIVGGIRSDMGKVPE